MIIIMMKKETPKLNLLGVMPPSASTERTLQHGLKKKTANTSSQVLSERITVLTAHIERLPDSSLLDTIGRSSPFSVLSLERCTDGSTHMVCYATLRKESSIQLDMFSGDGMSGTDVPEWKLSAPWEVYQDTPRST